MADPEIKVEVNLPEGETPSEEPAPEVVVVESSAPGGTDPGTILSLEMLRDQLTETRAMLDVQVSVSNALQLEVDSLRSRVLDLELEDESEPEVESETLVAEVIPPTNVEVVAETTEGKPASRKRKFV